MSDTDLKREEVLTLTADIVASHVANNSVPVGELSGLIEQVFNSLYSLARGEDGKAQRPEPAVPIKKSITPDFLICLEDGKKLKMLKRHLKTHYDMTPDDYREKWGLGSEYPMVAPKYAEQRRQLAKKIGLGKRRRKKK